MNRLLAIPMVCVAAVAAVAAGCGSGDEEAPTTTTSTTAATAEDSQAGDEEPSPPAERPGEDQRAPAASDGPEEGQSAAQGENEPSEPEFLEAADAICADLNAAAGNPPTATLAQIEAAARDSQELVATGLKRLGALEPAPGLEVIFGQFTDAVTDQQEVVAQLADAAAAGDVARVQAVALEVEAASARKNEIALAAGLDECGSMR